MITFFVVFFVSFVVKNECIMGTTELEFIWNNSHRIPAYNGCDRRTIPCFECIKNIQISKIKRGIFLLFNILYVYAVFYPHNSILLPNF